MRNCIFLKVYLFINFILWFYIGMFLVICKRKIIYKGIDKFIGVVKYVNNLI